jgi:putative inorganic carbon (HCO3(-)) transporter
VSRPTTGSALLSRTRIGQFFAFVVPIVAAFLLARPLVGSPIGTLVIIAVIGAGVVLVLNVHWAALTFVAIEPFEDYVRAINGGAVKALGALLILSWIVHAAAPGLGIRLPGPHTRRPGQVHRSGLGHPVALGGMAMVGAVLASAVLHDNGSGGSEVMLRYLSFLGALIVLVDLMYEDLPVRRVLVVFVASCAAAGVIGLIVFLNGSPRVSGPLGDPNDFAFFMVGALPLALVLRRSARRPILWDVAAVIIALATLGTLSRGALAAIAAMLVFAVLAGVVRARVIAAILAALVVAFAVFAVTDAKLIETSLQQKSSVASQNVDERLIRWRVTAEMTIDYPILGIGPGGFRNNYPDYIDPSEIDVLHPLDVAHETYLEISAELGLVGLATFLTVIGAGYAGARRRSRLAGDLDPQVALAGGICAAIIATTVAAIFLTEQYYLPLWMFAACGAAVDPLRRGDAHASHPSGDNRTTLLRKGTR